MQTTCSNKKCCLIVVFELSDAPIPGHNKAGTKENLLANGHKYPAHLGTFDLNTMAKSIWIPNNLTHIMIVNFGFPNAFGYIVYYNKLYISLAS